MRHVAIPSQTFYEILRLIPENGGLCFDSHNDLYGSPLLLLKESQAQVRGQPVDDNY